MGTSLKEGYKIASKSRKKAKSLKTGKIKNSDSINDEKLLTPAEIKLQQLTKELHETKTKLRTETTKSKKLEETLRENQNKFNEIINVSPFPQFVIDKDHKVIYWNREMEKITNIKEDEILGTKNQWKAFYSNKRPCMADFVVDGHIEEIPAWFHGKSKRSKFVLRYHGSNKSKILGDSCDAIDFFPKLDEEGKWLHFTAETIRNTNGAVIGAVETLEDITEQIKAQDEIVKLLEEKEIFPLEIHHRVKNNLQRIYSLLNLQSRYITDEKVLDVYKESQNRVKTVAIVHEKVYHSKNPEKIDFGDYVKSLIPDLFSSYGIDKGLIKLNINIKDILLNVDTAIPCGLIVNELVTNSIKHAFPMIRGNESIIGLFASPDEIKSEVDIDITKENEFYVMTVHDNGIGFPEGLDFQKIKTLGLQLVINLTKNLRGTVELERDNGTLFRIIFKELENKGEY